MNNAISNIKKYLLVVLLPTAIFVILALSSLKDIEKAFVRFRFGRDITLYLRRSTDHLTYLGAAYTATADKKFLEQFNVHLKERENYFNNEVFISKILTLPKHIIFDYILKFLLRFNIVWHCFTLFARSN